MGGRLTEKQSEAVALLLRHQTSKEIARELGISPFTVDQRLKSAAKRLGVSNRRELAQLVLLWQQDES